MEARRVLSKAEEFRKGKAEKRDNIGSSEHTTLMQEEMQIMYDGHVRLLETVERDDRQQRQIWTERQLDVHDKKNNHM